MPNLRIDVSSFTGNYIKLNGHKKLKVSKLRCIKAAKSIGVPLLTVASPSALHAMTMAAYKALAIKASIDFTGLDLIRPQQYSKLDPSEKGNISYWTGMTFATIAANMVLDIPQLIHAAALTKNQLAKTNPKGRSLADLVGQDTSKNWHVLEAKARQDDPSATTLQKWRTQATTVASIDNTVPATRSYCMAKVRGTYSARLVDPPRRDESVDLILSRGITSIVEAYYGSWRDVLNASETNVIRNGQQIRVKFIAFDNLDQEYIFIGITTDALKDVLNGQLPPAIRDVDGEDFHIGSDGLVIITSRELELK